MTKATTIELDIAKQVFPVLGADKGYVRSCGGSSDGARWLNSSRSSLRALLRLKPSKQRKQGSVPFAHDEEMPEDQIEWQTAIWLRLDSRLSSRGKKRSWFCKLVCREPLDGLDGKL